MKKSIFTIAVALATLNFGLWTLNTQAQYTQLTDFTGNGAFTGANPQYDQNLISVGGVMYGMTSGGGTNNLGTIFKIMPDGTGYAILLDFAGAINGSNPRGSLVSNGTFLYGMTYQGGTNNLGTLFKIMPD
ncbi:MAG: hypothetical protein FVQ77_03600, partial [Cytophagales bacterium]|nr:hypothetical protein [Cytophagales bacterium]